MIITKNMERNYILVEEGLFSHILFYAGYLTATNCHYYSNLCTFTVPNKEDRKSLVISSIYSSKFIILRPLKHTICKNMDVTLEEYTNKILRIESILNYDYEVQTVNTIINHDIETLNTVITKHGPRCDAL
ncbi:MAG: hypothetical protein MRQ07_00700 [Candidatus Midichloria sp.]|nr:hypothetical protein [Candidatus Midichloria sp.]